MLPVGPVLGATRSVTPLLLVVGGLIVALMALGLVILLIRGRLLSKPSSAGTPGLFDDLRAMRDSGRLTPEEYDAARRRLADRLGAAPSVPPLHKPDPP